MSLIIDKIMTYLDRDDIEDNEEVVSAYTIKQLGDKHLSEDSEAYKTTALKTKTNNYLKFIYDNRNNPEENWHYDIIDERKHTCKKIIPFINYTERIVGLSFEFNNDEHELLYQTFNERHDSENIWSYSDNPILTPVILTQKNTDLIKQFAALQKYAHYFHDLYPEKPSARNPITTKVNDDTFEASFSYDGSGSFHTRVSLLNEPENEITRLLIKESQDDILRKIPVRVSELSPTLKLLVEENSFQKENVSVY